MILNLCFMKKIQNGKCLIKWQNKMLKHIKRMNTNFHITNFVQAFSYAEMVI